MAKKIALIGASSFLGSKIWLRLKDRYAIISTCFKNRFDSSFLYLDLKEITEVKSFISTHKPEIIIMCASVSQSDKCERERELCYQTNVNGVTNILHCLNSTWQKIIYFSTDYIFNGTKGNYSEYDKPSPINYYGWTKLKAETALLEHTNDVVILRTAGLYGYNTLNNRFINQLNACKTIIQPYDCISSWTFIDDIIDVLPYYMGKKAQGIFHLAGTEPLSRYDFIKNAIDIIGFDVKVKPICSEKFFEVASRPRNSSLVSKKHNFKFHSVEGGLVSVKKENSLHSGSSRLEQSKRRI